MAAGAGAITGHTDVDGVEGRETMKQIAVLALQRTCRIVFGTFWLLSGALGFAAWPALAETGPAFDIGTTRVIESRVLNEKRKVYVYLPASYQESRGYHRYPVLYLRDGGKF